MKEFIISLKYLEFKCSKKKERIKKIKVIGSILSEENEEILEFSIKKPTAPVVSTFCNILSISIPSDSIIYANTQSVVAVMMDDENLDKVLAVANLANFAWVYTEAYSPATDPKYVSNSTFSKYLEFKFSLAYLTYANAKIETIFRFTEMCCVKCEKEIPFQDTFKISQMLKEVFANPIIDKKSNEACSCEFCINDYELTEEVLKDLGFKIKKPSSLPVIQISHPDFNWIK